MSIFKNYHIIQVHHRPKWHREFQKFYHASLWENLSISSAWLGGGGGLSPDADKPDTLEGGGCKPKCWHTDTFKEKGGRVETYDKYCCEIH